MYFQRQAISSVGGDWGSPRGRASAGVPNIRKRHDPGRAAGGSASPSLRGPERGAKLRSQRTAPPFRSSLGLRWSRMFRGCLGDVPEIFGDASMMFGGVPGRREKMMRCSVFFGGASVGGAQQLCPSQVPAAVPSCRVPVLPEHVEDAGDGRGAHPGGRVHQLPAHHRVDPARGAGVRPCAPGAGRPPVPCNVAGGGGGQGGAVGALEGKGPRRRPQRRSDRRLEEFVKAVGGGYCRLQMPLKLALGVRGTVPGHRLGCVPPPPSNALTTTIRRRWRNRNGGVGGPSGEDRRCIVR